MRAREADPLEPRYVVARAQELAEVRPDVRSEIPPPGVDVLAEERDLLDAVAGQRADLGDDLSGSPALLAAAHGRDDAVRALRVAAHRHLHPGLVTALAVLRQVGREVLVRAEPPPRDRVAAGGDPLAEVRDRAGAERDVDERVLLEDPLALRLGVAAADRDHEVGPLALAGGGVPEVGGEARVRLLADRAGVEDDDVGLVRRDRLAQAEGLEHALDPLGVVSVHLAAERGDVVPTQGRASVAPRLSRFRIETSLLRFERRVRLAS